MFFSDGRRDFISLLCIHPSFVIFPSCCDSLLYFPAWSWPIICGRAAGCTCITLNLKCKPLTVTTRTGWAALLFALFLSPGYECGGDYFLNFSFHVLPFILKLYQNDKIEREREALSCSEWISRQRWEMYGCSFLYFYYLIVLFLCDFTVGFDTIDHHVMMNGWNMQLVSQGRLSFHTYIIGGQFFGHVSNPIPFHLVFHRV